LSFRVLVVDDDELILGSLARLFKARGMTVRTASTAEEGLGEARGGGFDLILMDINLGPRSGLDVVRQLREAQVKSEVVMMTAYASVDTAVSALRLGATDYIIKPFEPDQILRVTDRLLERKRLIEANEEFVRAARVQYDFSHIITRNEVFLAILESIKRVASSRAPILIMGESGTGKELVARAVHTNSDRAGRPLIPVNCGAIPASLMEAEFFGHVKGAYTGAVSDQKGYFERADGSTLFLDEIGELPRDLQVKLLRALQESQINRVGDSKLMSLDFRLIAATQRDLEVEVKAGRFREDLYYRLNVFPVRLPPLRERSEDIPLLVDHFLSQATRRGLRISEAAQRRLMAYGWPGNVRELANVVERAAILAPGDEIGVADLPLREDEPAADYAVAVPPGIHAYKDAMKAVIDLAGRELINRALTYHRGNVTRAAETLGVSRRLLTYRMKELGLRGAAESEDGDEG
jgi:two-component system, NtrC family, response regulator AtoC